MKIWKSIVSLGLSLALTLPAAAAAFTDQAEIRHKEAVDGCVRLGIIGGYPEGDFRPQGGVTRAQMCKLICIAVNGGTQPDLKAIPNKVTFTDTASSWAKDYIAYCATNGIVSGMGDGRFAPDSGVTATQAAKMLLVSLGYDAKAEGFNDGPLWAQNVEHEAAAAALYDGLTGLERDKPLSRDNAARMIWNTLHACEVEYVEQTVTVEGQETTLYVQRDRLSEDGTLLTMLKEKFGLDVLPPAEGEEPLPGDGEDSNDLPTQEDHL